MREIEDKRQESNSQDIAKLVSSQASRKPPVLIVLCGPSHAGKTTFARQLGGNFTIISSDEIRKKLGLRFEYSGCDRNVWNTFESMKCKALSEGRNIILDACHLSRKSRWHAMQGPNEQHRKICVVFDLPFQTVRDRCCKAKRMLIAEVRRMWEDFQESKPTTEELRREGFDGVYTVISEYCILQWEPDLVLDSMDSKLYISGRSYP